MVRGASFIVKKAMMEMMINVSNKAFICCPALHSLPKPPPNPLLRGGGIEGNKTIDGIPNINICNERFKRIVLSTKDLKYAVNSVIMNDRMRYIVIVFCIGS